jgi:TonB family protein
MLVLLASVAVRAQAGPASSPCTSNTHATESSARGHTGNPELACVSLVEENPIYKVEPRYPEKARASRIQGQVVVDAIIDRRGHVAELKALSGHPFLIPAALDAVRQWRYKPYLLDGKAIKVETQIIVNFNLASM